MSLMSVSSPPSAWVRRMAAPGFLGLIELDRRQRHRGGRAGAFRIELLPAPRGLRARGDLLAFGGDLVGALRNLGVVGGQRRLDVAIGATPAIAARQRHVGQHEIGAVGIGGGQRASAAAGNSAAMAVQGQ